MFGVPVLSEIVVAVRSTRPSAGPQSRPSAAKATGTRARLYICAGLVGIYVQGWSAGTSRAV